MIGLIDLRLDFRVDDLWFEACHVPGAVPYGRGQLDSRQQQIENFRFIVH